ncbi:helicase [Nakamurella sp. YIM 132087]|uniref:Helicase n=1 Tax=Nakamurella alba TaxID=2665158 RepID=A0A7K1FMR6_9ACTN|nr:DEAD/DEAH box helicase [Nakamurella alba]MTD14074.1 helicase [Nakamurella alba]
MNTHPELAALVEMATYRRGVEYTRSGMARVLEESEGTVAGQVRGSGGRIYRTSVEYSVTGNGSYNDFYGRCSCPMGLDCKHAVALLLTAANPVPTGAFGLPEVRRTPEWERRMQGLVPALISVEHKPLAIGFELVGAQQGRFSGYRVPPHVEVRPLRPGKRGWVQLGSRWGSLRTSSAAADYLPDHLDVVGDLALVCGLGAQSYGSTDTVDLRHVDSPALWDVLERAQQVGVALIGARKPNLPVTVAPDRPVAQVELRGAGKDVELVAVLPTADGVLENDLVPIGAPAQGAVTHGPDGGLVLVRLAERADRTWTRLVEDGLLRIPAGDHEMFVERYLPGLAGAGVRTTGRARELATVTPPDLVLVVRTSGPHRVHTEWHWAYRKGSGVQRVPLHEQNRAVLRDPVTEAEVLAAVRPVLAAAGWSENDAEGNGLATVRLVSEVLPALAAIEHVRVEVTGDLADYREVVDGPDIEIGLAPAGDATDWFDLAVTVTLDGTAVPFDQLFRALAAGEEVLILPDGSWTTLDRPELQRLRSLIEEARGLQERGTTGVRVSRFQVSWFAELEELGVVDAQSREWSARMREITDADLDPAEVPTGLAATLRPYQLDGFRWLDLLRRHRLGGILADDMGLGKTVQTLAMILAARTDPDRDATTADGPWLVVAPTSVVGNWQSEAKKFAPELRTLVVTETSARRGYDLAGAAAGADIVITSYTLFRLEYEQYAEIGVAGLVLDEAQAIKNHQSKAFGCCKRLPAPIKLAITGTPVENNLMELWSLFSVVAPGLLGNPTRFTEGYRTPIERGGDNDALARLRRRIEPLMLRRTKDLVAKDLPPKQEQVLELELEPAHRRLYQKHLNRERQKVLRLIEDVDTNRFEILRSLTVLRQLAIDPFLVDPEADVPSTKLNELMDLLGEIAQEGHRVLVFSQFTRFLGRIRERLEAAGIEYSYLDGATRDRVGVVQGFKTGEQPVFLISLKAGGVGLNLAEADYCILTDPWWNPATEAQAVDRAHRIGQTRPVMVYRLVSKDTIEEKVMQLKAAKASLVESVMSGEGTASAALTAEDLRALLD